MRERKSSIEGRKALFALLADRMKRFKTTFMLSDIWENFVISDDFPFSIPPGQPGGDRPADRKLIRKGKLLFVRPCPVRDCRRRVSRLNFASIDGEAEFIPVSTGSDRYEPSHPIRSGLGDRACESAASSGWRRKLTAFWAAGATGRTVSA